ncbi:MAG: hypothetical protein ACREQ4_02530 [Candidatus Binataceae bacterium]
MLSGYTEWLGGILIMLDLFTRLVSIAMMFNTLGHPEGQNQGGGRDRRFYRNRLAPDASSDTPGFSFSMKRTTAEEWFAEKLMAVKPPCANLEMGKSPLFAWLRGEDLNL